MSRNSGAQSGFTLVEVLVVLTLISMLVTLMAAALPQIGAMRKAEDRAVERSVAEDIGSVLVREISAALDIGLIDNVNHTSFPMEGDSHQIRFTALAKIGYKSWGIREINIFAESYSDGKLRLLRTATPRRVIRQGDTPQRQVDEIRGKIISLTFAYLVDVENNAANWQDRWSEQQELPRAVRFTLLINAGHSVEKVSRVIGLD